MERTHGASFNIERRSTCVQFKNLAEINLPSFFQWEDNENVQRKNPSIFFQL
jgi:hypothetical protein